MEKADLAIYPEAIRIGEAGPDLVGGAFRGSEQPFVEDNFGGRRCCGFDRAQHGAGSQLDGTAVDQAGGGAEEVNTRIGAEGELAKVDEASIEVLPT